MIFLLVCSNDTCLFDYSGDIIHIYTFKLASVGVEPMNVACVPSTATSDALNSIITPFDAFEIACN